MNHHHLVLLCFTIFAFDAAYSQSKVSIKSITDDESKTVYYNVHQEFVLKCNISEPGQVEWQKDSKSVDLVDTLKGRFKINSNDTIATYTVKEPTEADAGTYTCVFIDKDKIRSANDTMTLVKSDKPAMKVVPNINVVEGETLKIECLTKGELNLKWIFDNGTHNETYLETTGRVKLEVHPKTNLTNGILRIDDIQLYDRGDYTCVGRVGGEEVIKKTATVRVKDKYAALWPFLGICAEVFVLCAIIFIYEKKRNKTELEESDTDQSPDQKNTPDHDKESNLRHRQ